MYQQKKPENIENNTVKYQALNKLYSTINCDHYQI